MITHSVLYILYRNLTGRLDEQRHRFVCFPLNIRKVSISFIGKHIEITPNAGFAITPRTEIKRSICLCKTEILVYTIEVSLFTSKRDHIRWVHTVFLIIHIELMDTCLVGMSRNTIIGHTNCNPYCTADTGTFTNHLHNPDFVGIGKREWFSFAIIAILLYKIGHDLDSLTSCTRTLQTDIYQTSIIDYSGRIRQFGTSSKSSFPNSDLILIHIANHIVCLTSLSNLT